MNEVIKTMNDQIARLYPESTLLEYLLNAENPGLLSIEEYLKISSSVPLINLYSGNQNVTRYYLVINKSN